MSYARLGVRDEPAAGALRPPPRHVLLLHAAPRTPLRGVEGPTVENHRRRSRAEPRRAASRTRAARVATRTERSRREARRRTEADRSEREDQHTDPPRTRTCGRPFSPLPATALPNPSLAHFRKTKSE
ncbi:hypothetical protein AOLI_G00042110 [Acnodon oligacanthus]